MGRLAIVVALWFCACIPPSSGPVYQGGPGYAPYDPNSRRTVRIVGALVSPGKITGRSWDGGSDTRAVAEAIASALATSGEPQAVVAGTVAKILVGPAVSAIQPPDPWGTARLYVHEQQAPARNLTGRSDTHIPQWSAEWINVDIRYARVSIEMHDIDPGNNEPMGTVDIGSAALLEAVNSPSGRLAFRAAEQTHNRILFVDIAVH